MWLIFGDYEIHSNRSIHLFFFYGTIGIFSKQLFLSLIYKKLLCGFITVLISSVEFYWHEKTPFDNAFALD